MQTIELTPIQEQLLKRMRHVGHTTIAGFIHNNEEWGITETESALRSLQSKGLVTKSNHHWKLTELGVKYAGGLA